MSLQGVSAWKLEIAPSQWVSMCQQAILEYCSDVALTTIPACSKYCNQVVKWRNHWVPVVDLHGWLNIDVTQAERAQIVILPFKNEAENASANLDDNKPLGSSHRQWIALKIQSSPQRIFVNDDHFNDDVQRLPAQFHPYVLSLLKVEDQFISVLDMNRLFLSLKPE